jgi:hypothetical protein
MKRRHLASLLLLCGTASLPLSLVAADQPLHCDEFNLDSRGSQPLSTVSLPPGGGCRARIKNGFLLPDPQCTPGATNPTLTAKVLQNPDFRTGCVRDNATTAGQKAQTYQWYSTPHPKDNKGVKQTCELDHLISLELGGADTLDNIWPQCGPKGVVLKSRFFKQKDMVENYLAKQVRDGVMDLREAQRGIASDWTQYLDDARNACARGKCR